jgi:DNA-binding beta-propeller fold protein YncE
MRGNSRASRAAALAVCLALTGGVAAAVAEQRQGAPATSPPAGPNADRFLQLTGDDPSLPTEAASGELDADGDLAAVGQSPELDGVPRTTMGWAIRPAGRQVDVLRFPLGITPTPDGKSVVVSSDSGSVQGLTVIDAASLTAVPTPAANLFMGVAAGPNGTIYASGGNADRVFRYQLAGPAAVPLDLTNAEPFPLHALMNGVLPRAGLPAQLPALDGISVPGYPGGLVLDGGYLYVAGTKAEASDPANPCPDGRAACAHVTIISTATGKVVGRPAVGLDAFGLAIDAARQRLYVSNWADEAGRGGSTGGTVSVLDISNPINAKEIAVAGVGHHPTALQLSSDRSTLFVANTNDDTISVLDVTGNGTPLLRSTESVAALGSTPVGAHPDAFAMSPNGDTLFVALAGLNAVELRDGRTGARMAGQPIYIPTGWYPSALTVTGDASRYKLWVVNMKGTGPGPGPNGTVFLQGIRTGGSVSAIDLPVTPPQIDAWTEQTRENDLLDRAAADACSPAQGIVVSEVLCPPPGQASPIKHVIYIVTENKTFDQYFGDINATGGSGYDADPLWTLYGKAITANHHALAGPYSLNDRFFSDAEVSVTGHSWTSGGIATDYNEKTWPTDYEDGIRGNHGGGDSINPGPGGAAANDISVAGDELKDPEGGYVFEAFRRAGAVPPSDDPGPLSMAIYGERTARESGDMNAYKAPGWKDGDISYFDSCRAAQFISGQAPNGPVPETAPTGPDLPELGRVTLADCGGRTLPPQFALAHWTEVQQTTGRDVMPSFIYMSLPVNHTFATNLGNPTPQSMVADNDYAIGTIVEALSRSPFWASTAIFLTEDDTQIAGDHISSLRDYLQVISPWAKPGPNHQWGSMPSLLRTIETIFGVEPFSLNDRVAIPQHGAFVPSLAGGPNLAPYGAVVPAVPFAVNEPGLVGQALSAQMDFSQVDRIDERTFNAILYAQGWGVSLDQAAAVLDAVVHRR